MAVSMAAARVIHCQLRPPGEAPNSPESSSPDQVKMVVQSRPSTLRSDHRNRGGLMKRMMTAMTTRRRTRRRRSFDNHEISGGDHDYDNGDGALDHQQVGKEEELELELSPILENLFENIEISPRKIYYFEIITGRLAMILFGVTVGMELATGDFIFNKMDAQGIAEGIIGCLAATTCAAFLAHSSTARKKAGRIFTISFNVFFETLINNIIDGLFFEDDLDEPSDNNLN